MIRKDVKNCSVFSEFTKTEQEYFFGVTGKKVIHNIDTLYYSVKLNEFDIKAVPLSFEQLLTDLRDLRDKYNSKDTIYFSITDDFKLEYKPAAFALYRHCLSLKNEFDIFIAETILNFNTPRIVVQTRSIALWADGDKAIVKKSFDYVYALCLRYSLDIVEVRENRIDYAFHTNCIQNADSYLTDDMLLKSLKSELTKYQKVGNIGERITVEYLSLGMRKSNNVFFRAYNKTREVVEMGYKSIFIEVWKRNGLISEYDKFVLERAYEFGSKQGFESAVAIGKIDWYLKFGRNDSIKHSLLDLRKKYLVDGSNNGFLQDSLKGILPDITSIMNFEFQTKRKYYRNQDKAIAGLSFVESDVVGYPLLRNLFRILDNRSLFLDKLTSETVAFVRDRNKPRKEIENADYLDFWRRIRSCKTPCASDGELYREYARSVDKGRAVKGIADKVAVLSVLDDFDGSGDFTYDLSDALCYFNDNDVSAIIGVVDNNGVLHSQFNYQNYDILFGRKKRQYKFLEKQKATPKVLPENKKPSPNG